MTLMISIQISQTPTDPWYLEEVDSVLQVSALKEEVVEASKIRSDAAVSADPSAEADSVVEDSAEVASVEAVSVVSLEQVF